ncbi:MAG TPA: uL14 family ribosomal protein [Mucilaginibacter sp.]|nr:uL14 family ribosomal protein [Mucilaginibacter sp.]
MIKVNTITKASDNAGGLLFRTIRIAGGHARRYAQLGEIVWSVVRRRRSYVFSKRKDIKERLRIKVKKKRKIKARKKADQRLPLYWTLLVATKKAKRRADGSSIKFDENRVVTFEQPEKFGPAGKTEGIPKRR